MVNKGATVAGMRFINAKNQWVVAIAWQTLRAVAAAPETGHWAADKLPLRPGKSRQSKYFHHRKAWARWCSSSAAQGDALARVA
jgi:hypothetical protein